MNKINLLERVTQIFFKFINSMPSQCETFVHTLQQSPPRMKPAINQIGKHGK